MANEARRMASAALGKVGVGRLLQRLLRRRTDTFPDSPYILAKDDFTIRLANVHKGVNRVEMLVTRMYGQRGYTTQVASPPEDADDNLYRVTLEACRDNRTVGTITVSLDRPEGLNAEDLYKEEIAPFRAAGKRLCEFNRLALDIDQCGKDALGSLFHLAVIYAYRIHRATDLFIEVNPRHAVFYRRKLGFDLIGEEKVCRRVNAPAVLLHKELAAIHEQIIRFGGLRLQASLHEQVLRHHELQLNSRDAKQFYSFFMAPWEERELVSEIREMLARTKKIVLPDPSSQAA